MTHYIPNDPTPAPRAEIIRRQDIIDQVSGLLSIYQEQQRQALQVAQTDATFGRALMLLALALALIIAVGSNVALAAALSSRRSPAAPDDASRITHQTHRQLAANDRRLLR